MRSEAWWGTAFTFVLISGCVIQSAAPVPAGNSTPAEVDPVVVAVIDSGINPYYDLFQGSPRLPAEVPAIEATLASTGTLVERLEADRAFWDAVELGQLYHFAGSRAYAIGFTERDAYRLFDSSAHGANVNYLVGREATDVVLVSIHVYQGACDVSAPCLWDPSVPAAMEWAADQPWIDVITVSMGPPANPPDPSPEMSRWLRASERASLAGKIITSAAGNDPVPSAVSPFTGPPWVIAVGGAQPEQRGEQAESSRITDVVSNYSESIPSGSLDGTMRGVEGTSFATPIVAATIAQALHMVRNLNAEQASPSALRAALNASAVAFLADEWRPRPFSLEDPAGNIAKGSLPILTQAQMGWGYVNSSLAPEIARRVLEGDLEPPAEKDQAVFVQAQYQRAREEYWANWPR